MVLGAHGWGILKAEGCQWVLSLLDSSTWGMATNPALSQSWGYCVLLVEIWGCPFGMRPKHLRDAWMWNTLTLKPHSPTAPSGELPVNTMLVPCRDAASSCLGAWLWQEVAGVWGSWCLCFPVTAAPGEARAHEQPLRGGVCRGLPALTVVSLVPVLPLVWHRRWVPVWPP